MKVKLIDYTKNGIEKIVQCTRATRLQDFPKDKQNKLSQEKFVKKLISWGHLGVLEHVYFTFFVSDISLVTTHQLVRHRMASYLQQTKRHVFPDKPTNFVTPPSIKNSNRNVKRIYNAHMRNAWQAVRQIMRDGDIPLEDARYLLPVGFTTTITITMNARELRHFFKLRCAKGAQWEIKNLALEMLKICYNIYPSIFEDLYQKYIGE